MYPHHVFDLEPAGTFGMYPICYQRVSGRCFQPEPAMYSRCFHWFPGPLAPSDFPITANKSMRMESTNSSTYQTLGTPKNIPITPGSVTVKLQIQVMDDAPFEVLLGRLFFDILSASEQSKPGGHHSLEIHDPSDRTPYIFLMKPRMSNFRHNPAPAAAPINFP